MQLRATRAGDFVAQNVKLGSFRHGGHVSVWGVNVCSNMLEIREKATYTFLHMEMFQKSICNVKVNKVHFDCLL